MQEEDDADAPAEYLPLQRCVATHTHEARFRIIGLNGACVWRDRFFVRPPLQPRIFIPLYSWYWGGEDFTIWDFCVQNVLISGAWGHNRVFDTNQKTVNMFLFLQDLVKFSKLPFYKFRDNVFDSLGCLQVIL